VTIDGSGNIEFNSQLLFNYTDSSKTTWDEHFGRNQNAVGSTAIKIEIHPGDGSQSDPGILTVSNSDGSQQQYAFDEHASSQTTKVFDGPNGYKAAYDTDTGDTTLTDNSGNSAVYTDSGVIIQQSQPAGSVSFNHADGLSTAITGDGTGSISQIQQTFAGINGQRDQVGWSLTVSPQGQDILSLQLGQGATSADGSDTLQRQMQLVLPPDASITMLVGGKAQQVSINQYLSQYSDSLKAGTVPPEAMGIQFKGTDGFTYVIDAQSKTLEKVAANGTFNTYFLASDLVTSTSPEWIGSGAGAAIAQPSGGGAPIFGPHDPNATAAPTETPTAAFN
ncbi:MAG: hypothetical protein ACRD3W_03615, partial [Terriglobales bacterium]